MDSEKSKRSFPFFHAHDSANDEIPGTEYQIGEDEIKKALLKRPVFSVRARLILTFILLFLLSAAISCFTIYVLRKIDYKIQYVTITDQFANEIQLARRIEKNYFLYGSDLSVILTHIETAENLLRRMPDELGHIISGKEVQQIKDYLAKYRATAQLLIANQASTTFGNSEEFKRKSEEFRTYGSSILERSLLISKKERSEISSTIKSLRKFIIIIPIILLIGFIFILTHLYKHIISRLNRLMDTTHKFAMGNFSPITPIRRYRDEFSNLAIALNHMMYEIDKRQNLLMESHKLRAIGGLTAGVAHELNNPLNNIILTSEILKENYGDVSADDDMREMINDLVTQAERAQQVVKNLLDYTRESEIKTEYLHISDLINKTHDLVKNQIKLKNIQFEMSIEENLPPIYGDRQLLIQVFLNLFLNAIDSISQEGKLTVKVDEEKDTGFLIISVSDTGAGIPGHLIKSIFNPFFTTKQNSGGTGLGLSVSQGIIEKHGGDIEVESKYGEGTTFIVHLPIIPIPADLAENTGRSSIDKKGPRAH